MQNLKINNKNKLKDIENRLVVVGWGCRVGSWGRVK